MLFLKPNKLVLVLIALVVSDILIPPPRYYAIDCNNDFFQDYDDGLQYERPVELFELFKEKFNITYSDNGEYIKRLEIFKKNLQKIKVVQELELGTAKYGITKFADLTGKG